MAEQIQPRSIWHGIGRGLRGKCPACGIGRLFSSYLKIASECPACQHKVGLYRADDGPAYFTILIVGHLFVAPVLFLEFVRTWPFLWVLALVLPSIVRLSLLLLPRVKGAFVGVQWAVADRSGRPD